jgi:catechol 2,3-dioxygenase-like lactoylglutathione lyase family enzyme
MKQTPKIVLALLLYSFTIADAQVKSIEAIGMTVKDMNKSVKFYSGVLGFHKISDEEFSGPDYEQLENVFGLHIRVVRLQLGDEIVELTDYLTSGGRSIPEDAKANDLSFQHIAIVVSDMDKAYEILKNNHVEYVSTEPQTLPAAIVPAAGIRAFYFHDPDNHNLELIYFPKGKGQLKWHGNSSSRLFLGIDHTAIAVSNTDSSLQFYQKLLGIQRKGESFNFGTEQEHLNNVEGARLHITGLRSPSGPGIEFLQYLKPGPVKQFPGDTKSNDIWHWQTTLIVDDAQTLYVQLKSATYDIVSRQLVTIKNKKGNSYRAFVVKDGDGHAMLIKQPVDIAR